MKIMSLTVLVKRIGEVGENRYLLERIDCYYVFGVQAIELGEQIVKKLKKNFCEECGIE